MSCSQGREPLDTRRIGGAKPRRVDIVYGPALLRRVPIRAVDVQLCHQQQVEDAIAVIVLEYDDRATRRRCAAKSGCGASKVRPSTIRIVNGRNGRS
jgi:hypothetical protein